MGPGEKYRFGPFEVHTGARELSKGGTKIKLRGQPYLILEVLLSRAGEVVTREEIRAKLWPADTFVGFEHGLNTSVKKLRQVLCDSAEDPRYIETVPRLGYRVGVPHGGYWRELLNSDAREYAGSGMGNLGGVQAEEVPTHGRSFSLNLTLPPLAALFFKAGG